MVAMVVKIKEYFEKTRHVNRINLIFLYNKWK